jgi:hypothetical protein
MIKRKQKENISQDAKRSSVHSRLYNQGMEFKEKVNDRSILRKEKGEDQCTFKPNASSNQKKVDPETGEKSMVKDSSRTANDFYTDMMRFKLEKEERLRAMRQHKQDKSDKELSILMNQTSRSISNCTPRDVSSRLHSTKIGITKAKHENPELEAFEQTRQRVLTGRKASQVNTSITQKLAYDDIHKRRSDLSKKQALASSKSSPRLVGHKSTAYAANRVLKEIDKAFIAMDV